MKVRRPVGRGFSAPGKEQWYFGQGYQLGEEAKKTESHDETELIGFDY
jgi:hypothetical protein